MCKDGLIHLIVQCNYVEGNQNKFCYQKQKKVAHHEKMGEKKYNVFL